MIQEKIDQIRLLDRLAEMDRSERKVLIDNIVEQVCWHGPVTREWLAEEMGVELDD